MTDDYTIAFIAPIYRHYMEDDLLQGVTCTRLILGIMTCIWEQYTLEGPVAQLIDLEQTLSLIWGQRQTSRRGNLWFSNCYQVPWIHELTMTGSSITSISVPETFQLMHLFAITLCTLFTWYNVLMSFSRMNTIIILDAILWKIWAFQSIVHGYFVICFNSCVEQWNLCIVYY